MMKIFLIGTLFFLTLGAVIGQEYPTDNPNARLAFELSKYVDPETGEIPRGIYNRELSFAKKIKALSGRTQAFAWANRGPFNVGGRTRALAIDVDDENIILAGGVSGGVWKTIDLGTTWIKTTAPTALQSVSCIAQDRRDGQTNVWYYGTGEFSGNSTGISGAALRGDGIFRSEDGGASWALLENTATFRPESFDSDFDYNFRIVVDEVDGDVFVANYGGIYRSNDGGQNFVKVLENRDNGSSGGWTEIVSTTTGTQYAVLSRNAPGVYRSTNGTSWELISSGGPTIGTSERRTLVLDPSNEDLLFIMGQDNSKTDGVSLWRYNNSTGIWTDYSANIPQYGGIVGDFNGQISYNQTMAIKPNDSDLMVLGGINLHRSTSGFRTTFNDVWIGGYVQGGNSAAKYFNHHPDQHAFAFLDGDRAISGNDGGLQLTEDITAGFVQWKSLNNGYLTTQVYAISVGPGDQIMAGFQDNSSWLTTSAESDATWTDQFSGDGAYNDFNIDGTVRWVSSQNGNIWKYNFSDADDITGSAGSSFTPNDYESGMFIAPFSVDKETDIFYLGGDVELYINPNASTGSQWTKVILGAGGFISEFGTTSSNMVYAGTTIGGVYKVTDTDSESPIVQNITDDSFPAGYVSSISVNPYNSDELIVTFSNYSIRSVFHSSDGGKTFQDVSSNLEENLDGSGSGTSVRTSSILGDGFRYYVGTSTGLYQTEEINGESTIWSPVEMSNIGNVVVEHMVSRKDGLIAIGTHGNGIYSTKLQFFDNDLKPQRIVGNIASENTSNENITVNVLNLGEQDQASFDISLYVDGVLIVTDNVEQQIDRLSSYEHTFSSSVEFTVNGAYEIKIATSLTGDQDNTNDEFFQNITVRARPSSINLSSLSVNEHSEKGTLVGVLSTSDLDAEEDEHSYQLVAGEGDSNNSLFQVLGSTLITSDVLKFIETPSLTIRLQTEDRDGNKFAKSFTIEVNDVTGFEELEESGITIFPNPVKNKIMLEMINDYVGNVRIEVLAVDGRTLIDQETFKAKTKTNSLLNLSQLESGVYLIKITQSNKQIVSRLIKN